MGKIPFLVFLAYMVLVRADDAGGNDIYKYHQLNGIDDDQNISWKKFMIKARWTTNNFVENFQPYLKDAYTSGNVSKSCVKSFQLYFEGLKKWEPWAIKMADATGRIPSGLLTGTKMDFGSFDECLQVRAKTKDISESFRGQYCTIEFKSPLVQPMHLKVPSGKSYTEAYGNPSDWIEEFMDKSMFIKRSGLCLGTCLPSTCSEKDLYNLFSIASKPWVSKVFISNCQDDVPKPWPTSAVASIIILSILFGICLLGTILDLKDRRQCNKIAENSTLIYDGFCTKLLKYFSFYTNSIKVFKKRKETGTLDCLDGIRVFLSMFVVGSHCIAYTDHLKEIKYSSVHNLLNVFGVFTVIGENAYLNMENFAMISGFLLVYSTKKVLERNGGKLNLIEFVIKKYFRLMPAFIFLFITLYAMPVMNSGPIWNSTWKYELDKCQNSWWRNIIFIQNFVHMNEICMLHSWFIGSLLQMQLVGVILMLITFRWRKTGIMIGALMVALCISIDFITALSSRLYFPAIYHIPDFDNLKDFVTYIYFRPFNHFSSFVCGMILSWIMLTYQDIKLSKTYRIACWITAVTFFTIAMYGVWFPTRDFRIISAYYALRTIAWGLSCSWVFFSLLTGQLDILNRILSSEALVPLMRISYSIFVFHPLVLLYRDATRRERIFMGYDDIVFDGASIIVFSIGIAFIGHITVEQPFTSIYDLLHKTCISGPGSKTIAPKYTMQMKNGKPKLN